MDIFPHTKRRIRQTNNSIESFYFLSILQISLFVFVLTKCLSCRVGMDGWRKHVTGVKSDHGVCVCVCVCVCVLCVCAMRCLYHSTLLCASFPFPSTLSLVCTHKKGPHADMCTHTHSLSSACSVRGDANVHGDIKCDTSGAQG